MKNISRFVSCIVVICFAITLSIVAVSIPKVNNLKIANAQDDQFQKYDVTSDDFALACDSSGLDELSWADSLVYQKYPYGQCSNQYSGRNTQILALVLILVHRVIVFRSIILQKLMIMAY